ncbi:MAG: Flp pilus assembly protein CpaB [Clostridia bacterium]|nr:Flp pilus assembly protein CpaB [Clostridia bacterium]
MKKIYLIAVIIALAAGVATYFFANELKTSSIVTGVDDASVVVAIEDIEKDTILTEDMFQVIKLPVTAVSFGTVCNPKEIIGYMTTEKIYAGEQLMARKITTVGDGEFKNRLSYELSNGMYAYSIGVSNENAVSHFIKEYDYINIYKGDAIPSAEPILKNVQVIRISDYTANVQQEAGIEITSYSAVTLALTKQQIPILMGLDNSGAGGSGYYKIVLVSHVEGKGIADDLAKAPIPEDRSGEPATNYGMGEITTAPPVTKSN